MRKQYNGVSYDTEIDYKKQYDTAVANGDYVLAAAIEKVRNAKIDGEGLNFAKTNNYSSYASPAASASPAEPARCTAPPTQWEFLPRR